MMNKRWKIAAVLAVIMVALASNVMAQYPGYSGSDVALEATAGKSNTKAATAGLFSEDRDNYLSPTGIGRLTKNLIFVNIFAPKFLGGDPSGVNGFLYNPYFDAGAGFFIGQWWIGFAFNYGVTETKNEVEGAEKVSTIAPDGTLTSAETTENATKIPVWEVNDGFQLAAIFGNKTWGVKNDLQVTTNRSEGYQSPSALGSILGTYAGTPPTGSPGETTTVTPGDTVTKNELTRGETNGSTFKDTLSFGISLGNVIPAIAGISPWASAKLIFAYDHEVTGFGNTITTSSGYGWEYELRDAAGTKESTSYAEDVAANVFKLGVSLQGGVGLKINDIFTFSPDLSYDITFPIYGNKYTDIGGGEETAKGVAVTYVGSTFTRSGYWDQAANPNEFGPINTRTEAWRATVYELSGVDQNLGLGLKIAAKFPRLDFAVKYSPKFFFSSLKQTTKSSGRRFINADYGSDQSASYEQTYNQVADDQTAESNTVTWINTIDVGAKIWLKEDKFRLNLGSSFKNQTGNWITTKTNGNDRTVTTVTKKYDDGHEDNTTKPQTTIGGNTSTSTQTFSQVVKITPVAYSLGFTFFMNENVNLDFLMKTQENQGENWLELLLPAAWALQFNIRY
jgi:hypothetical protein